MITYSQKLVDAEVTSETLRLSSNIEGYIQQTMDCTPHKCVCYSSTSLRSCQCGMTSMGTITTTSPDHFIVCNTPSKNISQTAVKITLPIEDLKTSDHNARKRNVPRVLFEQKMEQPAEGHEISHGHHRGSDIHDDPTVSCEPRTNTKASKSSRVEQSDSTNRRQLISDSEVQRFFAKMYPRLIAETNGTNSKDSAIQLCTSGKTQDYAASWPFDKSLEAYDDLANERLYFPNNNDDDVELDKSWVGYEDDLFKIEIDRKKWIRGTNGFLFDPASNNRMIMRMGQRFKNDVQFRTALEVNAIRDGFKLCIIHNTSTCVSCECSNPYCDWKITAVKENRSNVFVIYDITPMHTCNQRSVKLQGGTKWIAAKFLNIWKQSEHREVNKLRNEIATTYGIKCPIWKLEAVDKMARFWLRTDHADGYAQLLQYKQEMEIVNSRNIVIIETISQQQFTANIFGRMFVFLYDTAYAFKTRCRMLVTVDGWEIDSPYKSVMLVAVCRDGNDSVLPIAFCEVVEENLDSWAFFLKNLNYGLRLERGEGLCIMGDGDNGIDEAVEEFLPSAVYRQCCFSLYTKMVHEFPGVTVHSPFWGACRSTNGNSFKNQMAVIETISVECYNWLKDTDCQKWALYSMPEWVKSTEITVSATEQLRIWLLKQLDLNVAHRYTTITRKVAEIFQRRYLLGWEWVYDKITPAVRQQIIQNTFEGEGWTVDVTSHNAIAVVTRDGLAYEINRELMTCTCRLWPLSGIPCPHACRCINTWGDKLDTYVHRLMTMDEYRSAYGPGMNMLPQAMQWKWQLHDNTQISFAFSVCTNHYPVAVIIISDGLPHPGRPDQEQHKPVNERNRYCSSMT
ncbi:hypothetical protein AB3S75_034900 [Citrus x aurantiifolia]